MHAAISSSKERSMSLYDEIFVKTLALDVDDLSANPTFADTPQWDSLCHMELIAALEDSFDVMLEPDEITHFESYENGKKILASHGVEFEA